MKNKAKNTVSAAPAKAPRERARTRNLPLAGLAAAGIVGLGAAAYASACKSSKQDA